MATFREFGFNNIELFKNMQELGSGSYGRVYKAKCDGVLCAAKVMHPDFLIHVTMAMEEPSA